MAFRCLPLWPHLVAARTLHAGHHTPAVPYACRTIRLPCFCRSRRMPRKRADKLACYAEPAGTRHFLIRQHAGKVQVEFRQRSPDAVQPTTSCRSRVFGCLLSERYSKCEWFATLFALQPMRIRSFAWLQCFFTHLRQQGAPRVRCWRWRRCYCSHVLAPIHGLRR